MWTYFPSLATKALFTLYGITFHSDGNIRGCLHYTAYLHSELVLSQQKQVLTAVIYSNISRTTILSSKITTVVIELYLDTV